jgi:hypothetical protein
MLEEDNIKMGVEWRNVVVREHAYRPWQVTVLSFRACGAETFVSTRTGNFFTNWVTSYSIRTVFHEPGDKASLRTAVFFYTACKRCYSGWLDSSLVWCAFCVDFYHMYTTLYYISVKKINILL